MKDIILNFARSKNINNAAWSVVDAVVYPALMLLATPVFIEKLGVEMYGLWMFINTIMASIGVLNIGLGDATVKFVSKYLASGEKEKVNKVIGATYSVYLVLCGAVMLVAVAVSFVLKEYNWLHLSKERNELVFYTIQIAGLTLGLKFMEQIFLAVFKGYERYDVAAKISTIGKVTTLGANLILVLLNFSLIYIFIGSCMLTLAYLLVEAWLVYRFSNFKSFLPSFEKLYIREVFSFGIWTWFQSILGIFSGQIDKFIVVSVSDIKTFAYYSIAFTIFTQIHGVFSASVSWIFPVVSKKIYMGQQVKSMYNKIQFYFLGGVAVLLTAFYLIKDPFILLWLKQDTYDHTIDFIRLFVAVNMITAINVVPNYFFSGSSHFKLSTIFTAMTLVSRMVLIPLTYYLLGTLGLMYGVLLSTALMIPIQYSYFTKTVLKHHDPLAGLKVLMPAIFFFFASQTNNIWIILLCLVVMLFCYRLFFPPSIPQPSHES